MSKPHPGHAFIAQRKRGELTFQAVSILTSHPKDDSYTPSKISVRCGTSVHDLQEVRLGVFDKPDGWQYMPLRPEDADGEEIEG